MLWTTPTKFEPYMVKKSLEKPRDRPGVWSSPLSHPLSGIYNKTFKLLQKNSFLYKNLQHFI